MIKKQYEAGKFYNFSVVGLSGNRIDLLDECGDSFYVRAYDFQVDWDWASSEVPIEMLPCYVKAVYNNGNLLLEQKRELMLAALYPKALNDISENNVFVVREHKLLDDILYYIVWDPYGLSHMYKPKQDGKYVLPGDEITLSVDGIILKDNNKSCLKLSPAKDINLPLEAETDGEDTPVGEFGEESETVEFKSTIIYPAGATGADIDCQMEIIVRTLAGFMNANGGVLYIGVNDNGIAVGIEKEYSLLNISKTDGYYYKEDKDGYQNKIRNTVARILSPVAQDYLKMTFPIYGGHTVCKCEAEAASTVIWFKKREAYKRTGNRTTHLASEAIEKLIMDKHNQPRMSPTTIKPLVVHTEEEIMPEETMLPLGDTVVKVKRPMKLTPKGREKEGHGSFYMNLFSNGDWSWSKSVPSDDDLEFCVPINSPASKNDLLMVYEDGCVNRVDAYHIHTAKEEGRRYKNGRRNDGVRLLKAFSAKNDDLIACFSKQYAHPYAKVHSVSHVSSHQSMNSMGNRMINMSGMPNVSIEDICFVASQHAQRVSALMKTENQTSSSLGFQMDLAKNTKFLPVVATVKAVCDIA